MSDVLITPKKDTLDMRDDIDLFWRCLITGGLGSLAGVAALLRSGQPLSRRAFWTALLNSGLFSLSIGSYVLWKMGEENFLFAVVLSVLAGLGGNALIDFALGVMRTMLQKRFEDNDDGS